MDLGLFEKSNRPSRRGGVDFGLFRRSNRPSKCAETTIKSPVNPLKTHIFRLPAALLEGLLELLGGVGPWTFPNVQSTLREGGLDLGPFRKSNRPSGRGGVGPWTFKKSANPCTREGVLLRATLQSDARTALLHAHIFKLNSSVPSERYNMPSIAAAQPHSTHWHNMVSYTKALSLWPKYIPNFVRDCRDESDDDTCQVRGCTQRAPQAFQPPRAARRASAQG